MHPEGEEEQPQTPFERDFLLFFWVLFGALILFEIARDFTLAKLAVPFFFLSWAILLVVHEMAHALVARALNWRVDLISLGFGRVRRKTQFLGMPLEVRTFPISGFVMPVPMDLKKPRTKDFLIYAAGPGSEILLILLIGGLLGWETLLTASSALPILAAQSFCLAAAVGVVLNLVPFPIRDGSGEGWQCTDGLGMLRCWSLPLSVYEARLQASATSTR